MHSKADHVDQVVPIIEMDYWYLTGKPPERTDRSKPSSAAAAAAPEDEDDDPFAVKKNAQT